MANRVLDSWALIAFFEDEPAADAVEELLDQASREKRPKLQFGLSFQLGALVQRSFGRRQ
jgi:hypothetical protein